MLDFKNKTKEFFFARLDAMKTHDCDVFYDLIMARGATELCNVIIKLCIAIVIHAYEFKNSLKVYCNV